MASSCTHAQVHPLAPLTLEEIERAVAVIRQQRTLGEHCRFPLVELHEPAKAEVLAFEQNDRACPRLAKAVMLDKAAHETFEGLVDLSAGTLRQWRQLPFERAPYGQAPVMLEEFELAVKVVTECEEWRAAVKRRGLSDEDLEFIQVDPWSFGYWGEDPRHVGKRLMRGVAFYREKLTDNGYAHPIEGLVAIIDLDEGKVIELLDDGRDVPVPRAKHNYDTPSLGDPREGPKPLHIIQPEGVSFQVDGWKVSWQGWEFRVGFTPREGLVLHRLGIHDQGRFRPVMHRASITDMAVPYSHSGLNHYWKCAFDGGEYGLGRLANTLELGCDCLGAIHYFDVPAVNDFGEPFLMKNAICMHEEDYGTLWKHYEFRSDVYEMRRSRRLVISFFATVGNYDYGFFWYLYQDGTVQLEAKLTGIIQTGALAPGERPTDGAGMVTPELFGPTHQHFFGARLHMDVDGGGNSVVETEYLPYSGGDNPQGNLFDTVIRTFQTELEACREANGATGRFWKVINPDRRNAVGNPTGYKLVVEHNPVMLAQPGSHLHARAGFASKHLWVTAYDPAERYSSGEYVNQHQGDGVHKYVEQNRPIANADVVLWHTLGHTHTCKPEDFPIMPVQYVGFKLMPNNFFDSNPAMGLPAQRDARSVHAARKSGCGGHDCKD